MTKACDLTLVFHCLGSMFWSFLQFHFCYGWQFLKTGSKLNEMTRDDAYNLHQLTRDWGFVVVVDSSLYSKAAINSFFLNLINSLFPWYIQSKWDFGYFLHIHRDRRHNVKQGWPDCIKMLCCKTTQMIVLCAKM